MRGARDAVWCEKTTQGAFTVNSKYLAALALGLALDGCPYSAAAPVAEASTVALDQGLIGQWRCMGGDDDKVETLSITRTTATEFVFAAQEDKDDPDKYKLHSAKSGTVALANLEDTKANEPKPWSLVRMVLLRPNVLQIELGYSDAFEKAAPGTRSADIVAQALKAGTLFRDGLVCSRAPKDGP